MIAQMARLAFAPMLTAGMVCGLPDPAAADTARPTTCTVAGMDLSKDPVFRAALHPSDRQRNFREIACAVESTQSLTLGDTTVRLTLGRLHDGKIGDPLLNARLMTIETIGTDGSREAGRVVLGPDPLDGAIRFDPQIRSVGDSILIRLGPRHPWLFRLQGKTLTSVVAFDWRESLDKVIADTARGGSPLSIDLERMEGRIAVRSPGADPGTRMPSAYDESRVIVARLFWRDGLLVADSAATTMRKAGEEPFLDQIAAMDEKIRKGLKNLPEGTEPCSLGAWSTETDPKGLNVRAAPGPQSKVLGIVPPARRMPKEHEAFGLEPAKAEFRVVGHRAGWFLIEAIKAPGVAYDIPYPRQLPQPFKGRGWVSGRMIGGALANGGLPPGRLYVSPHADAASTEIVSAEGSHLGPDTPIRRIHACTGWWALIETQEGQRGWWRAMCSNQVTNCS